MTIENPYSLLSLISFLAFHITRLASINIQYQQAPGDKIRACIAVAVASVAAFSGRLGQEEGIFIYWFAEHALRTRMHLLGVGVLLGVGRVQQRGSGDDLPLPDACSDSDSDSASNRSEQFDRSRDQRSLGRRRWFGLITDRVGLWSSVCCRYMARRVGDLHLRRPESVDALCGLVPAKHIQIREEYESELPQKRYLVRVYSYSRV